MHSNVYPMPACTQARTHECARGGASSCQRACVFAPWPLTPPPPWRWCLVSSSSWHRVVTQKQILQSFKKEWDGWEAGGGGGGGGVVLYWPCSKKKKKEIKKPKELMRQRHTRLLAHKDTHSKRAVKHTHTLSPSLYLMFVRTLVHSEGWP